MYITLTFLHIQFKIMYSTLTAIEHLFQLSEVSHIGHVLTLSKLINKLCYQIILINL